MDEFLFAKDDDGTFGDISRRVPLPAISHAPNHYEEASPTLPRVAVTSAVSESNTGSARHSLHAVNDDQQHGHAEPLHCTSTSRNPQGKMKGVRPTGRHSGDLVVSPSGSPHPTTNTPIPKGQNITSTSAGYWTTPPRHW